MKAAAYCRNNASSAAMLSASGVSDGTGVPARVALGELAGWLQKLHVEH